MKLNHLNLTVTDVASNRTFFERYFGLRGFGPVNDAMAFLRDDNGSVVVLFKGDAVSYPSSFHIGFIQESRAQVDEIHRRLKDDGFDVKPPREFHGSWTFYFQSPGGFTVEVLF